MPYYLLPRQRSVSVTGTLRGRYVDFGSLQGILTWTKLVWGGFGVTVTVNMEEGVIGTERYYIEMTGFGVTERVYASLTTPPAEYDLTGTFTLSVPLQDAHSGGTGFIESPQPGGVASGTITFGTALLTWSALITDAYIAPTNLMQGIAALQGVLVGASTALPVGSSWTASITAAATYSTGQSWSLGDSRYNKSFDEVNSSGQYITTWDADGTGGVMIRQRQAVAPVGAGANKSGFATFDLYNQAPAGYDVTGKLFAGKSDYPSPMDVEVNSGETYQLKHTVTANPTFTDSRSGTFYDATLNIRIETSPVIVFWTKYDHDQGTEYYTQANLTIAQASLDAIPEKSVFARQVYLYGYKWDALNLVHLSAFVVEDGAALSTPDWQWTGQNAAISAGDALRIDASASAVPGTALRTSLADRDQSWGSYRYARVRLRSVGSAGQTVTLKVYTRFISSYPYIAKTYTLTTGADGTFVDRDVDLCSPTVFGRLYADQEIDMGLALADGQESIFPAYTQDGPYWGCSIVHFLKIIVPAGIVVEVDAISLERHLYTRIGMWPGSARFTVFQNSTATCRPSLRAETDGRMSLEAYDDVSGLGPRNIRSIRDQINEAKPGAWPYFPGWAADLIPTADPFYNEIRPAAWLGGRGVTFHAGDWTPYKDIDATGPIAVPAQVSEVTMTWYPGCGDVIGFTDGHYGGNCVLRAAAVLRADAQGIVFDQNGAPLLGKNVEMRRTDVDELAGSNTTDAQGVFLTGAPLAKSQNPHSIRPTPLVSGAEVRLTSAHHWRHRACFRATNLCEGPNPWNYQDQLGRYHRVCISSGGNVCYSRSDSATPVVWAVQGVTACNTGDCSDPHLIVDHREIIYIVFARSVPGHVWQVQSWDDGLTWSQPAPVITNGTHPTIAIDDQGTIIRAAWVSPNLIRATRQYAGDINPSAEFTFKDAANADLLWANDTFHLMCGFEGPQRWILAARVNGESNTSDWWSADDGATWTRIT